MKPADLKQRQRLARALIGNLLQLPGHVLEALSDSFTPEALPGPERKLFTEARTIAEGNGREPDSAIEPGELLARIPDLDTDLFAECVDLSSTSADAARQAAELTEIYKTEELRGAANALLKAETREDLDQAILHLYDLAEMASADSTPSIRTLAEYLKDPDALKPPRAIAPRLAWHARTVLLAAREKAGKSTLASGAAAAISKGADFLEGKTEQARVLYVALEDHPGDVVRRLQAFGANPENIFILDRVQNPLPDLRAAVGQVQPALTIIDTLPALVESLDLDPGSSSAWVPVMMSLTRLARDSETALLILHHANKSGSGYRDSSAIGAAVDMIIELEEVRSDETARRLTPRGRWSAGRFTVQLEGAPETGMSYTLGAGLVSVDAQVLAFIEENPGCSVRALRDGVGGNAREVDGARERLLKEGLIVNNGNGRAHAYHTRENAPCLNLDTVEEADRVSVSTA